MRGDHEEAKRGQVECDCPHCESRMDVRDAIHQRGKYYCSEACADGHQEQAECARAGCACSREEIEDSEW